MGKGKKKLDPSAYATTIQPRSTPVPEPKPEQKPKSDDSKKQNKKAVDASTNVSTNSGATAAKLIKPWLAPELASPTDPVLSLSEGKEKLFADIIRSWGLPSETSIGKSSESSFDLETAYETLLQTGFQTTDVEHAVRQFGSDVESAMNWLCLNLPSERLPKGWSMDDNSFNKIPLAANKIDKQPARKVTGKTVKIVKRDIVMLNDPLTIEEQAQNQKEQIAQTKSELDKAKSQGNQAEVARLGKLLSALKSGKVNAGLEVPNSNEGLSAKEQMLACLGVDFVMKKQPVPEKEEVIEQAREIEDKKSKDMEAEEDEEGFGLMFDEEESEETSSSSAKLAVTYGEIKFEGKIPKGWSGPTPKSLLLSLMRKRGCDDPKFVQIKNKSGQSKVTLSCGDTIIGEFESGSQCNDRATAEELAATRALYKVFAKDFSGLDIQLPGDFRDVWKEWKQREEAEEMERSEQHAKPRREFVAKLIEERSAEAQKPSKAKSDSTSAIGVTTITDQRRVPSSKPPRWTIDELTKKFTSRERIDTSSLPVHQIRASLIEAHLQNPFVVLVGETGSGKTTQVPQLLLEAYVTKLGRVPRIAIAEPRRVSATSVSKRVGEELASPELVGYQIRGESTSTDRTCLNFCTTGVLLRRAQQEPLFMDYDVIIVDEVHERTLDADVLLVLIRSAINKRNDLGLAPLRCVAMSATMNAENLSNYFGGCPILRASGRTFPVRHFSLEEVVEMTGYDHALDNDMDDSLYDDELDGTSASSSLMDDSELSQYSERTIRSLQMMDETLVNHALIEKAVEWSVKNEPKGAILVFLPGLRDIEKMESRLCASPVVGNPQSFMILPLHSSLSDADQLRKVFDIPKDGRRKIVLSTNIAETGVTIPDVTVVIDTCRVNQVSYNEKRGMVVLTEKFCSKASAEQRAGRAGRVQEGMCLRLVSKATFANRMENHSPPEMGRVPLDQVCLTVLCQGLNPRQFFPLALDPPPPDSVVKALGRLERLGAISSSPSETNEENVYSLTPLGRLIARLPVDARVGKMIVFGCILGCPMKICAAAACATAEKSGFKNAERKRRFIEAVADSDVLTEMKAFLAWEKSRNPRQFAKDNWLDHARLTELKSVRDQLVGCVRSDLGVASNRQAATSYSDSEDDLRLVMAALSAGSNFALFTPEKARTDMEPNHVKFMCEDGIEAKLVQSSVAFGPGRGALKPGKDGPRHTRVFAYTGRMKTTRIFLTDLSAVHPMAVALFGGNIKTALRGRKMMLDGGWITVRCVPKTGAVIHRIRMEMERVLEEYFLNPTSISEHAKSVLQVVIQLLQHAD